MFVVKFCAIEGNRLTVRTNAILRYADVLIHVIGIAAFSIFIIRKGLKLVDILRKSIKSCGKVDSPKNCDILGVDWIKEKGRYSMKWKTVYVFVSSTFNDMHAERDLLVKRVFPELRLWCARRKLQLRDIDLRWGVSAADAQENKRVVEVCLRNIDKCRPFFLCFMGQRRGWVPRAEDINPETLEAFPELRSHIGSASVTEMEVIHALLQPMVPAVAPVRHARFYFRDGSYAKELHSEAHKNLYIPGRGFFRTSDKGMDAFKKRIVRQFQTVEYTARWNPDLPSPELTGELSKGRLEDFQAGGDSLEKDVLGWLKDAIQKEYPDHQELAPAASELDRELDRQDTQRFQCGDGYIPRPAEEQALARSLEIAEARPLVLLAQAGCGKTSLLAAFLQKQRQIPVYFRFVGTTPQSFRLEDLSASLTEQWVRDGLLPESVLQYTPVERKLIFSTLCVQAAEVKPFLLVLDGMDQLLGSEDWYNWIPKEMPSGASLLMSLQDTGAALPDTLAVHRLGLMTDPRDKAAMASAYLSGFLKDIDKTQMDQLLAMEGSDNPLYMKIVLNELRQHGSFDTLMELLRRDYGSTPLSAFRQILARVERELNDTFYDAGGAMALFFGCLAYAQQGLDGQIFLWACRNLEGWDENVISDRQVLDLAYGLARELEPFLVQDGNRIALRYDSFRQAIRQGYAELMGQYTNILLAQAFLLRLGHSLEREDVRTTLMHVVDATDDYIHGFFTHPARMVLLIRCGGAEMVAKSCDILVRRRNMTEFADLAKVLRKTAPRLEANPKTLFMELDRFGDHGNCVTGALLSSAMGYDTGILLKPRYAPNASGALCWEYSHLKSTVGCEAWTAPYFVHISDKILKVTDLRTLETVHVMHLPHLFQNSEVLLTAEGDILFLCQRNREYGWIRIFTYRLPDMMPLTQPLTVDCLYGGIWKIHAHEGQVYAIHCQRMDSGRQVDRYTLTCLSTGRVLFQEEIGAKFHYELCGGWFVYRNDGSGDCRVLSLEDGSCLFEDRFLGTEHLEPEVQRRLTPYGKLFANTASMYASAGEKLYIWQGGSRIKPEGGIELMQRMHRLAMKDGVLTLEQTWNERVAHHSSFTVLGDQFLIFESQGYVQIMDADCRLLGKLDLGESIRQTLQSNTRYAMFDGQILMFYNDRIRSYDAELLVSSLEQDLKEGYVGRRSTAIIDDALYVMEQEMERIDLHTLEVAREKHTEDQYTELYDPWNMQGQGLWIGYGVTRNFSIKRQRIMGLFGRYTMPDADCRELRHAFLYRDDENILHVGLLQSDKTKIKHLIEKEEQEFAKLWLRTKPLGKMAYNAWPWTQTDLNAEFATGVLALNPTSVMANGRPYLILPNVYKDQWTIQLCVYDLLDSTFIYKQQVDQHDSGFFDKDNFHPYPGGVIYGYGRKEGKLEALDLTVPKVMRANRRLRILTKDHLAKQVCLYDRNSRELLVYDTATHGMARITTLGEEFEPYQAILLERHVILNQWFNQQDMVKIYDRGTGALLYAQRLEVALVEPMFHEATGTIAMVDNNGRKYFWKVEEYGK